MRSRHRRRDGLFHQQQSVLRNGITSTSALLQLGSLARAWRSNTLSPVRRSAGLICLALFHIAAFGAAGIFSSRVTLINDEVLIQKGHCGWQTNPARAKDPANFTSDDWAAQEAFYSLGQLREESKIQYTRACYAEQNSPESSPCMALASKRLDSSVNATVACPFAKEICDQGLAIQFDSGYINSDRHLGINAPFSNQVYYRIVTTWTPVAAKNFTSNWTYTGTDPLQEAEKLYYLGPLLSDGAPVRNYTFFYGNFSTINYPHPYYLEYATSTKPKFIGFGLC
jgi:hypothetical protein